MLDHSIPVSGTLEEDLNVLQDDAILQANTPAYILAKLDQPSADWLAIYFVPDDAKVRDKVRPAPAHPTVV